MEFINDLITRGSELSGLGEKAIVAMATTATTLLVVAICVSIARKFKKR